MMHSIYKSAFILVLLICALVAAKAQEKPELVVEKGNNHIIKSVRYSPDGKHIITTCPAEATVKSWETTSGRLINTIAAEALDAWYSESGYYLVIEEQDKCEVYDAYLQKFLYSITKNNEKVLPLSFANKDSWLVVPGKNSLADIINTDKGNKIQSIATHHGKVLQAKLFADNFHLLVLSEDSTVSLINIKNDVAYDEKKLAGLMPFNARVSGKGNYAAIAYYQANNKNPGEDTLLKTVVIATATGRQILSVYSVDDISPDESSVIVRKAKKDSIEMVLQLTDGNELFGKQEAMQYSADGKHIYLDSVNTIITIDSKTGATLSSISISEAYVLKGLQQKKYYELLSQHQSYIQNSMDEQIVFSMEDWLKKSVSAISPDGASKAIGLNDGSLVELSASSPFADTMVNGDRYSAPEDVRFTPAVPENELNRVLHNNGLTLFTDPFNPIIDAEYVPHNPYIFTKTWDNYGIIWNNQDASIKYKKDLNYFGLMYTDLNQSLGNPFTLMNQPKPTMFSTDGKFFSLFNPTGETLWKTDSLKKIFPVRPAVLNSDVEMLFQKFAVSSDGNFVCSVDRSEDDPARLIHIFKMDAKSSAKKEIHTISWGAFYPDKGDFSGTAEDVKFAGDSRHMYLWFYGQFETAPFALKLVTLKDGIKILGINPQMPADGYIIKTTHDSLRASFSKTLHAYIICTNDKIYYVDDLKGRIIKTISVQLHKPQTIDKLDFDPNTRFAFYKDSFDQKVYAIDIKTGKPVYSLNGSESSFSTISFSPDHTRFATLTEDKSGVSIWDVTNGDYVGGFKGHTTRLLNAVYSADGKFILCCAQDGSYEKRNAITRELIYTFFLFKDYDYAIVLPEGYYYSSSRSDVKYLNFRLRSKLYNFSQFDLQFNRPDKVLQALGSTDTALINAYQRVWVKRISESGFTEADFANNAIHVPDVTLLNRSAFPEVTSEKIITLFFSLSDSLYNVTGYNIYINDVPLFGMKGNWLQKPANAIRLGQVVSLDIGINKIEIDCVNEKGEESRRETFYLTYQPAVPEASKTWFIGIGINRYSQHGYLPNLMYCVKDIRDLAASFKVKYSDVQIDTLMNEDASKQNILALKKVLMKTNSNDRVIISFNGHGMNDHNEFYFATPSLNPQSPEVDGISYAEMQNLLDSIPARRKLLLIDACHSGESDDDDVSGGIVANGIVYHPDNTKDSIVQGNSSVQIIAVKADIVNHSVFNLYGMMKTAFIDLRKNNGAVVIAASQSNQQAHEQRAYQNGLFTHCLLNQFGNVTLNVSKLLAKINENMRTETRQQQSVSRQELSESDWALW